MVRNNGGPIRAMVMSDGAHVRMGLSTIAQDDVDILPMRPGSRRMRDAQTGSVSASHDFA